MAIIGHTGPDHGADSGYYLAIHNVCQVTWRGFLRRRTLEGQTIELGGGKICDNTFLYLS